MKFAEIAKAVTLTGTDKQVAFANSCRENAVHHVSAVLEKYSARYSPAQMDAFNQAFKQFIEKTTDAKFWIEHQVGSGERDHIGFVALWLAPIAKEILSK